ncbi:Ran-specific GTPase-activating protein 30 [Coniosporium tulheliwenetii]|uniref:Ran-specific GTPase-activating protein 30 n=1 Tax=Coniosporium tulheliwenetii TaxID=3383036 RepID=A0ACC2YYW7_9PEZI|nr:Ran-specific GTPase-activating protein 30 [Cladosporium sp. JES 115]
MDILLSKVTQQAMNYAIRSGVTITAGYAIRQCSRLAKNVKGTEKEELASLQLRLESKIRIISPAIDMIELIAARGNTSLESAVTLTKALRWDIQSLGVRLAKAASEEELARRGSSKAKSKEQNILELKLIISDIKRLLERIEDAVPLINLAITTSGVSLSTTMPATVSPSRLLQASTFLTAGDTRYAMAHSRAVQIGPTFTLSIYMLFGGHAYRPHDEEGIRETTWKEVIHKARVKLVRIPLDRVYDYPSGNATPPTRTFGDVSGLNGTHSPPLIPAEGKAHEFAYQLLVIEDLDDDRVHTFEEGEAQPGPFEDVATAGIREVIPIHEISKIFYADTGRILNIGTDGETNNPILLLKRDVNAVPPRRMMERRASEQDWQQDDPDRAGDPSVSDIVDEHSEVEAQLRRESSVPPPPEPEPVPSVSHAWRFPPDLDPEWLAFEVYTEAPDSDDEDEEEESDVQLDSSSPPQVRQPRTQSLASAFSNLTLRGSSPDKALSSPQPSAHNQLIPSPQKPSVPPKLPSPQPTIAAVPALKTSLSLLEMLIRLTALQQFQQSSHLAIPDELLTFFLSESSSTGAGGDAERRRREYYQAPAVEVADHDLGRQGGRFVTPSTYQRGATPGYQDHYEEDEYEYDDGWAGAEAPSSNLRSIRSPPTPRLSGPTLQNSMMPSSPSPSYFGNHDMPPPRHSRHGTPTTDPRRRVQYTQTPPPTDRRQVNPLAKSGSQPATPPLTLKTRQSVMRRESSKAGGVSLPKSVSSPLGREASVLQSVETEPEAG